MKKVVSALIICALFIVFCGCEAEESSLAPEPSEAASTAESATEESDNASEEASAEQSEEQSEASEEVSAEISQEVSAEVSEEESGVEASFPDVELPQNDAVFLDSGFVLYNGAAYTQSFFSSKLAPRYADVYVKYKELFSDSRINVIIAPLASITIMDKAVSSRMSDQGKLLDKTEAAIYGDVNFVNLKNIYVSHADEYLFFKSDHHWTHRGAYYAYYEFARSVGLTPTPIESFEKKILRENFIGSMHSYTGDDRVATYYDTVEAYYPTKACQMTVTYKNGGTQTYDTCIVESYKSYSAFIAGDYPLVTINVPENPQDKSVLVIKDSYGNAFVPYLTEHYGNIVVIDPRHSNVNVYEQYKDYGFDDIVFLVNSSMGNTSAWCNYFEGLIK